MAIDTQPESAQAPGGGGPGATPRERAWWLRTRDAGTPIPQGATA